MSLREFPERNSGMERGDRERLPDMGRDDGPMLSVVLPVFNEEAVLRLMYHRLKAVAEQLGVSYEILFVDDGSRDGTARVILDIARADALVAGVFFTRHFGKEAALVAGLKQAGGRAVIIMDGDLQDPPELIAHMLRAWREGADVVRMCPRPREGASPLGTVWQSSLARFLRVSGTSTSPAQRLDFMLYSRRAVSALSLVVNRKRYMADMFEWAGLDEVVMGYERQPRAAGASKWSLAELLGHPPDGTRTPLGMVLRIATLAGVLGILAGPIYAGCAWAESAALGGALQSLPMAHAALLFAAGAGLYFTGRLGQEIERICPPMKGPMYSIKGFVRFGGISPR
jgi:hypothetical protein